MCDHSGDNNSDSVQVALPAKAEVLMSQPPSKKMKQARLPFKVLSPKVTQTDTSAVQSALNQNALKKRKLSDNAPGPIKASKTPRNDEQQKIKKAIQVGKQGVDGAENEVSSSSETEVAQKLQEAVKPVKEKKTGIMDMFLRTTQQLEVSTTINTDENGSSKDHAIVVVEEGGKATEKSDSKDKPELEADKENVEDKCDSTADTLSKTSSGVENEKVETVESASTSSEKENQELKGSDEADMSVSSIDNSSDDKSSNDSSVLKSPNGSTLASPSTSSKPVKRKLSDKKEAEREIEKKKREEKRLQEKEEREKKKQKELDEKKKRLEEEKEKKDKEKEDLRLKKEQEKKEKNEQREKEKQEKLDQKEKERLEKLKQKEDEKKKKEEERLKKLEEKNKELEEKQRLKEEKEKQDKEGKQMGKKEMAKQKSLLSNFFIKTERDTKETKAGGGNRIFHDFPIKEDMRLAPVVRVNIRSKLESLKELDTDMQHQESSELYIKQLKEKKFVPGKGEKTWPSTDQDVMIVDDDDEDVKAKKTGEMMKSKYILFHENHRPPYHGTWRKKSKIIHPRNPLAKDKLYLDYEIDSDDEWEEEEPGESVSDSGGEGDDDEKAPEDDDEEDDGFFVPHGYLSEDEVGDDDDDDITPERLKARQLAKAKAFEADMSSKMQQLKPIVMGCCWILSHTEKTIDPAIEMLKKFQMVSLVSLPIDLTATTPDVKKEKAKKESKAKANPQLQAVPEEAIADLVRLVHGNVCGVQNLVKEFREYWRIKESGADLSNLNTSQDSQDGDGEADISQNESLVKEGAAPKYSMSKRQLDKTIRDMSVYEKRAPYKRNCWYVNDKSLEKYNLTDLPVPSNWSWVTKEPNMVKASKISTTDLASLTELKTRSPTPTQNVVNKEGNILKFAKPGISPKFPIISPKPVKPVNTTPILIRMNPNSTSTPKHAPYAKGTPSSLFKPLNTSALNESDDCAIVSCESPLPLKADKNQRTLVSMFGTSKSKHVPKQSVPLTTEPAKIPKVASPVVSQKTSIFNKNNHASPKPNATAKLENIVKTLSKSKVVETPENIVKMLTQAAKDDTKNNKMAVIGIGSADCPMEID